MNLLKDLGCKYKKTKYGDIKRKYRYGLFFCEYCEKKVEKRIDHGFSSKSCGCVASKLCLETKRSKGQILHNQTKTRLYRIWAGMKHRCKTLKGDCFKYYGGKGIFVCKEWSDDFFTFKKWAINNNYQENLEIDRKDNSGPYSPENCRFVTRLVNSRNRDCTKTNPEIRKEIKEKYFSGKFLQKELADLYNIETSCISRIVRDKYLSRG